MSLPYGLCPAIRQTFYRVTADGLQPVALGTLYFFVTGTSTPASVYASPAGTSLGTSLALDADGMAPLFFLGHHGYRVTLKDADGVTVWSKDGVENVAEAALETAANDQTDGSKGVGDGYVVLDSDNFVTVNEPSISPAKIYIQAAASRGRPLIIMNVGPTPVAIHPFASESINDIAEPFALAAASAPTFPTRTLLSDGVGNSWCY